MALLWIYDSFIYFSISNKAGAYHVVETASVYKTFSSCSIHIIWDKFLYNDADKWLLFNICKLCFKGTRSGERVVIRRGQLKGAYLKLVANVTPVSVLTRLKVKKKGSGLVINNFAGHISVADPDLQIKGGGAGLQKKLFRPFGLQFGLIIRGGPDPPGPLAWIRHCIRSKQWCLQISARRRPVYNLVFGEDYFDRGTIQVRMEIG